MNDALEALSTEFAGLVLDSFDETRALALGQAILRHAAGLPVVVNIRSAQRTFFHAALPGSAPLNDLWARRKSATALMFQQPSLLVTRRLALKGGSLADHGLDSADYAASGGAVPVMVRETGLVAVATVSGLPEAEDHALVVAGLREIM